MFNNIKKAVFVFSTGRTGTQYIAKYFDLLYPNVTAFHQPKPYREFRIYSNKFICKKMSYGGMKKKFITMRKKILASIVTPIYMESNNYLYGFGEVLEELFNSPLIFHIVRHPYDFIQSQLNFNGYSGLKRLLLDYYPYWTIKPEDYNDYNFRWAQMNKFEKYAWVWAVTNKELDYLKEKCLNYHLIKFEEIFDENYSGLKKMNEIIGLKWNYEKLKEKINKRYNASVVKNVFPWRQWDKNHLKGIAKICSIQASKYLYDLSL